MAYFKSKNNKILVWVLGVVLAGIWGEVGYRLIWGEGSADEGSASKSISTSPHANKAGSKYNFIAEVRDPFSYRDEEIGASKKVAKPAVRIWAPPPLKLEGVIIKHGRRTAIIESSDGKTFFKSPGDTLYGVKILSVDNGTVKYHYERKDTNWAVGK
jgi:hypothetical protein